MVKENGIAIESLQYSIINIYGTQGFIPNTQQQEYKIKEGGLGLGLFLSPGVEFTFNENVAVDLLGSIYWTKINLMHYSTFRPQYNVMLRFVFSTIQPVASEPLGIARYIYRCDAPLSG